MRNLMALVGAATVTFVGLGWYLDWYKVERQPAPTGTQRLQVDLNPKKIGADVQSGIEKGADFVSHLRDKSGDAAPAAVPNPALPGPAQAAPASPPAPNGWHPIDAGPTPGSANKFNLTPLPPPR